MRNAHSSFSRAAAQEALDRMATGNSSLSALAQGVWADTSFPIDVFMRGHTFEFEHLKDFDVGGPQGSPMSNFAFPAAIDHALKSTVSRYPRVHISAIQDDIDMCGPPETVFGDTANGGTD